MTDDLDDIFDIEFPLYARFWQKFFAYLLDGIPFFILDFLLEYKYDEIMAAILGIVLYVLYKTAFHGSKYQATPGKILIGIKVVGADGNRITYTHSFMRSCAELISELILFSRICNSSI